MWFHMANITLYIPDELKQKMDKHKEMRWSMAIRSIIEEKLEKLERTNKLASKSELTWEDVRILSHKVNKGMGKRARELLSEASSGR